jgi:hypothetical protein
MGAEKTMTQDDWGSARQAVSFQLRWEEGNESIIGDHQDDWHHQISPRCDSWLSWHGFLLWISSV